MSKRTPQASDRYQSVTCPDPLAGLPRKSITRACYGGCTRRQVAALPAAVSTINTRMRACLAASRSSCSATIRAIWAARRPRRST